MLKTIYSKLDKRKVAGIATLLLTILVVEIVLTCIIPMWKQYFFDVLNTKDSAEFPTALMYFFALMLSLGSVQGIKTWIGQKLAFQIRIAGNKTLLKAWVYSPHTTKNYTQPITESLHNWTNLSLVIFIEVLISASIIIGLVVANWNSPLIVLGALVYTIIIMLIAIVFNKPLVNSNVHYQSTEGIYRESISDIANGNGDYSSKSKFKEVASAYTKYIRNLMYFTLFSKLKLSTASAIPFILLAPAYFSGSMTLGDFMAGVSTFELLVINSTILLAMYPEYTKMIASYNISNSFYEKLDWENTN